MCLLAAPILGSEKQTDLKSNKFLDNKTPPGKGEQSQQPGSHRSPLPSHPFLIQIWAAIASSLNLLCLSPAGNLGMIPGE